MAKEIIIYQENYKILPKRFADKIEFDLTYIQKANIPSLKKSICSGVVQERILMNEAMWIF